MRVPLPAAMITISSAMFSVFRTFGLRWPIIAALCGALTLVSGCSTLRIAYATAPDLVYFAINKPIDPEELGGWKLLTGISGLADLAVDTDEQALDAIKRFLSYLPSNNMQAPTEYPVPAG